MTCCFVSASSPLKGSSRNRISHSANKARKIATLRLIPPESSDDGLVFAIKQLHFVHSFQNLHIGEGRIDQTNISDRI